MTASPPNLEPLATHLEPRFGNIYEINLDQSEYDDVQVWTPELAKAVKQYLLHEVSDDDYRRFLDELEVPVPDDSREAQASLIIDKTQPWQVAHAFHLAAVKAVSTLDQLIGHLDTWPYENNQEDAALWLEAHTDEEQLHCLVETVTKERPDRQAAIDERLVRRLTPTATAADLVRLVNPPELLAAWYHVAPTPSDLTDAEWQLLLPHLPQRHNTFGSFQLTARERAAVRKMLNGLRYKMASGDPWRSLPPRYGRRHTLYQWYSRHRKRGLFTRMLTALEHNPDAVRLVEWLRAIEEPTQPGSRSPTGGGTQSHNHPRTTHQSSVPSHAVRTWARSQGYAVAKRGRIPRTVMQAYQAVQPPATAKDIRRQDTDEEAA